MSGVRPRQAGLRRSGRPRPAAWAARQETKAKAAAALAPSEEPFASASAGEGRGPAEPPSLCMTQWFWGKAPLGFSERAFTPSGWRDWWDPNSGYILCSVEPGLLLSSSCSFSDVAALLPQDPFQGGNGAPSPLFRVFGLVNVGGGLLAFPRFPSSLFGESFG